MRSAETARARKSEQKVSVNRNFMTMTASSTAGGSGRVGYVSHPLPQVGLTSCHGQSSYPKSQRTIREKLRSTARVAA